MLWYGLISVGGSRWRNQKKPSELPVVNAVVCDLPLVNRKAFTRTSRVRQELAYIYKLAKSGRMDTGEATKLTYILHTLSKMIESEQLEARLATIEMRVHQL